MKSGIPAVFMDGDVENEELPELKSNVLGGGMSGFIMEEDGSRLIVLFGAVTESERRGNIYGCSNST